MSTKRRKRDGSVSVHSGNPVHGTPMTFTGRWDRPLSVGDTVTVEVGAMSFETVVTAETKDGYTLMPTSHPKP